MPRPWSRLRRAGPTDGCRPERRALAMITRLKEWLANCVPAEDAATADTQRVQIAAAALLIAVSRADYADDPREQQAMRTALARSFSLTEEDVAELVRLAEEESARATSDYAFTRLVNEEFSEAEKSALLEAMWRVAFADGELHRYEEHLIRKIAALLYIPHSEFIRTKLSASAP